MDEWMDGWMDLTGACHYLEYEKRERIFLFGCSVALLSKGGQLLAHPVFWTPTFSIFGGSFFFLVIFHAESVHPIVDKHKWLTKSYTMKLTKTKAWFRATLSKVEFCSNQQHGAPWFMYTCLAHTVNNLLFLKRSSLGTCMVSALYPAPIEAVQGTEGRGQRHHGCTMYAPFERAWVTFLWWGVWYHTFINKTW